METTTSRKRERIDWEQFGFETARHTRDFEKAKEICALRLNAYEELLQPDIRDAQSVLGDKTEQYSALCQQMYDPEDPVEDKKMLTHGTKVKFFIGMLIVVALASFVTHTMRFLLFGLDLAIALAVAVLATLTAAVIGHLAFAKLLPKNKVLHGAIVAAAACMLIWALYLFAQAGGGALTTKTEATADAPASYVEGAASEPNSTSDPPAHSDQNHIKDLLTEAATFAFLSLDLALGIVLWNLMQLRIDEKYALWRRAGELKEEITEVSRRLEVLLAKMKIAQRECMAGILRFFHAYRKPPQPPYFKAVAGALLLVLVAATAARAQNITRQEAILIDASGSIAAGGANNELLREYLAGTRRLLATEPPTSRVMVSLITTESFGSTQELLKAWTPPARGIFTDDLDQARHQLVSAFETKTAGVRPIAAGTDIIGGLWRMKALLESGPPSTASVEREIWIFSDMMNETPSLPMPALLASGPESMLEHAKAGELLVPLKGYKVHVVGASTRGLTSLAWNAIKAFWTAYFRAAGAELVSYSTDVSVAR